MTLPKPHIPLSDSEKRRFWVHVDQTDECWRWKLRISNKGYGQFGVVRDGKVKQIPAHRVSFELTYGPIPDGLFACHTCDNGWCVRPDHIFIGTHQDNMDDRNRKGRQVKGDRTRSRLYPETLLRGDAHPLRRNPELAARGERNGARLHIEKMPRGERNGNSKLSVDIVRVIRDVYTGIPGQAARLGRQYGVASETIMKIIKRRTWRHIP